MTLQNESASPIAFGFAPVAEALSRIVPDFYRCVILSIRSMRNENAAAPFEWKKAVVFSSAPKAKYSNLGK